MEHQDSVVRYLCKRYKMNDLTYAFGTLVSIFFTPEEFTKQQLVSAMLDEGFTEKDIVKVIEEIKI